MILPTPTVATERLLLRPFDAKDGETLFALMSDANVLRYWDEPPWTERSSIDRFLAQCRTRAEQGSGARLAIERASDHRFLGWCGLNEWDADFRSATVTYCLLQDAWGQGYATEAMRALVGWAYATLDLNRLQGEADTRNSASARVLAKLGFVHEGTLREDCIVNGEVSDTWVYGLLRRDWEDDR